MVHTRVNQKHLSRIGKKNEKNRRSKRIGRGYRCWKGFFADFGEATSLHGIQFITRNNHHWCETWLWAGIVFFAVICAISLIAQSWVRYNDNPTVISIEKNFRDWEIDFPAVTACYVDRANLTEAHLFISEKWGVPPNSTEFDSSLQFLIALTNASYNNLDAFSQFTSSKRFINLSGVELSSIARQVMNKMEYFTANEFNMDFIEVATELGLCYTYGGSISHNLSPSGSWQGLQTMKCNYQTPLCGIRLEEFPLPMAFHVHSTNEIPDLSSVPFVVETEMEVDASFRFQEMTSSPGIRKLRKRQRRCRFTDEPMRGDKFYSYRFCQMKCRKAIIMNLCGCAPFFYSGAENVCDVKGMVCAGNSKSYINQLMNTPGQCSCYANCNNVEYRLERVRNTQWKAPAPVNIIFRWSIENFSKSRTKRDVIFGAEDLLVSLGGIAALFLGSSIISFVELFNFFFLRWFWRLF